MTETKPVTESVTKLVLDPDLLKPSDLYRAEKALAKVLDGRDPEDLMELASAKSFREWFTFLVWCFRSRSQPKLTWEQAADTEFAAAEIPWRLPEPATASPNGAEPVPVPASEPADEPADEPAAD